jgi:hypothetical protein
MSPERSDAKAAAGFEGDEEEYEVKEVEQPRAAEFHASSSSEDEAESDEVGDRAGHGKHFQLQMERSALGRPKTAAKDLEKYRDVVPNEFFQQFDGAATLADASSPPSSSLDSSVTRLDTFRKNSARTSSAGSDSDSRRPSRQSKYKVHVPPAVEELFSVSGG